MRIAVYDCHGNKLDHLLAVEKFYKMTKIFQHYKKKRKEITLVQKDILKTVLFISNDIIIFFNGNDDIKKK